MATLPNGPYFPRSLADGTVLTVEQQAAFRMAADMAHSAGLAEHHRLMTPVSDDPRRSGEPDWIWANVQAAGDALSLELPAYGECIRAALRAYVELASEHENAELCHHCSDADLAALAPKFDRSGPQSPSRIPWLPHDAVCELAGRLALPGNVAVDATFIDASSRPDLAVQDRPQTPVREGRPDR